MSWLDDLQSRVEQSISNAGNSVFSYLDNRVADDPAVIVGQGSKGNQSAAQISQGQFGGPAPMANAKAPAASTANAKQASMFSSSLASIQPMLPVLLIGGALAFVLAHRKG